MPVSLDVFDSDPFKTITLTAAIEKIPFKPDGFGALGLFEDFPIYTETAAIEERDGLLTVIPFSERGTAGEQRTTELRKMRNFQVPRLRHEDTITAREVANIREFGTESVLMQVMTETARRFAGPTGLLANIEYTWEYHRLAAIQGLLLDANGSTVYNYFTDFGVTQPTEVAFNLAANLEGTLRPLANQVYRGIARAAKGAFTRGSRVYAACGDEFWDALVTHQDVVKTFYNWQAAAELRTGAALAQELYEPGMLSFQAMLFGDIYWFNYRGSDDNSAIAIATNKCKFFPVNAPGIFRRIMSPGESIDWVNTLGRPYYARIIPDLLRNEWVKPEVSSYPLHICTRPATLVRHHG